MFSIQLPKCIAVGGGSEGKKGVASHFVTWLKAALSFTEGNLKFPLLEEELVKTRAFREDCTHLILQEALGIPGNGSADRLDI